jgi:hypothetical protein
MPRAPRSAPLPDDLHGYALDAEVAANLHDYEASRGSRERSAENKVPRSLPEGPSSSVSISVTDDWPVFVPISEREVRIHETHLAEVLNALLGPLP